MLEFSPAPLSMLETQTESMENNFFNNIELGERGVFFSNSSDHGCRYDYDFRATLERQLIQTWRSTCVEFNSQKPVLCKNNFW